MRLRPHASGVISEPQTKTTTTGEPWCTELAARESNGVAVVLYWSRPTNLLVVTVADAQTGERLSFVLQDGESPLDAFYHPYAYAAVRGLADSEPRRSLEVVDV
jgi:hypothetical protein